MTPKKPQPVRIVLATANTGKLRELRALLDRLPVRLVAQDELGVEPCPEPAPTFVENALAKARHAAGATGLGVIADDSGLMVDALDGEPGVHSARYAGDDADDAANNARLLEALRDVAPPDRGARFVCVAVFLSGPADPCPCIAQGVWVGRIVEKPRGTGGFGYDPLFEDPALGLTSAELAPEQKNRLSHRARAFALLVRSLGARLHSP